MKKVLYVILSILVLFLLLCLFGPKETIVQRTVIINASPETVKSKVQDFDFFQKKWSPWTEKDPNMTTSFEGTPGQPGYKYSWKGNKDVGSGSMTFMGYNGDTMKVDLRFLEPWESQALAFYIMKPEGSGTSVTWGMWMENPFIARGMHVFMNMDKMLGGDFEKGLAKLKTEMESAPATAEAPAYEVKELEWPERTYAGTKKATVTFDKLGAFFGENFPKMGEGLKKEKLEMETAPSAIYFSYDEKAGQTECAAVVGVKKGATVKGLEKYDIPACKVLHVAYYGDYMKMMAPHEAIKNYANDKKLNYSFVIEEYVTDPMAEKDTAKWLTNIYYVLK